MVHISQSRVTPETAQMEKSNAVHDMLLKFPVRVDLRISQNRKFYTNEEELEKATFEPGISVDIDFVTVIAIKLALDILNRKNPNYTTRLLGHLTQYTLICNTNNPKIGGDNAEIFSYPLQVTTSIEVPYATKEEKKE